MAERFVYNFELYYNTLLGLFPKISWKYIEQVCLNPPFHTGNPLSEDDYLHMIIDHLCSHSVILEERDFRAHSREDDKSAPTKANLSVECQCCSEEFDRSSGAYVKCEKCSQVLCNVCLIKGTDLAIANGESSVKCFMGCNDDIGLVTLRRVLPARTLEMLMKKRQEAEIAAAKLTNLEACPFCPYQMEIDPGVRTFYCQNPECMRVTCRLCKKNYHYDVKCKDVLDEHKGRLLIEEEMSRALIRSCYRCNKAFVIQDGCNKIKCSCGAIMCYRCRKRISGYEHFNVPGGCPMYDNWREMNRVQVARRRKEIISRIRREFPNLKIPKI